MEPSLAAEESTDADLRAQLAAVRARLDRLEALASTGEVEPSPWEQWRRAHWDELMAHAGERVAIHPTLGIVAHHADVKVVVDEVRKKGLSKEVLIESVRRRVRTGRS